MKIEFSFVPIFGFLREYDKGKNQLFKSHIEPLMRDIEEIHTDYITAFIKIRSSLKDKKVPNNELLDFLEDRRHELAAKRNIVKTLAAELERAERRMVRNGAWISFKAFCEAIVEYFEASDNIGSPSWYTQFIHFMKTYRLAGIEDSFFDSNPFGNDPRTDIISHINIIVEERLPKKLNKIHTHYSELRSALL